MKLKLIAAAAGMALSLAAQAAPISLQAGPMYLQFNNMEQAGRINTSTFSNLNLDGIAGNELTTSAAEFNWGVVNISSVQAGGVATPHTDITGGTSYFADGFSGGQVHGIFYGFTLSTTFTLTGGYMDLYWTDGNGLITAADLNGGFAPTNRTDWNKAGKFTQGTLLARVKYQSGVTDGDNVTTVSSTSDPLSFTGTGVADGYASVMDINGDGVIDAADGTWAASLNSDWFWVDPNGNTIRGEAGETRDLRFTTRFENMNSWDGANGVQGLHSNDPARAFVIPEPASLALAGIALLGLGLSRRRNSK